MIKRGDIWIAHLGDGVGSEQLGARPVLVIQNDIGNEHSPTVIVAVITDKGKRYMPTHVHVKASEGLNKDSKVLLEQIRTIDKRRLGNKVTTLSDARMLEVNERLKLSIGLIPIERGDNK